MPLVPFVKVPVGLLQAKSSRDVHVYGAIASYAKDWVAFPGEARLAAETRYCLRTVRSAIQNLKRGGWLRVEREPRPRNLYRNKYYLHPVGGPGAAPAFAHFALIPVELLHLGTSAQVHVYGVIRHHADRHGLAYPTQAEIAAEWGRQVRQTRTVIGELEAGGWLTVSSRPGGFGDEDPFGDDAASPGSQNEYHFPPVGNARSPGRLTAASADAPARRPRVDGHGDGDAERDPIVTTLHTHHARRLLAQHWDTYGIATATKPSDRVRTVAQALANGMGAHTLACRLRTLGGQGKAVTPINLDTAKPWNPVTTGSPLYWDEQALDFSATPRPCRPHTPI